VVDTAPGELADRFIDLLLSMSYDDPEVRPLLDLEGLRAWRQGRTTGYALLDTAINETAFYDATGAVTDPEYRP
jgi:hypothetical protein